MHIINYGTVTMNIHMKRVLHTILYFLLHLTFYSIWHWFFLLHADKRNIKDYFGNVNNYEIHLFKPEGLEAEHSMNALICCNGKYYNNSHSLPISQKSSPTNLKFSSESSLSVKKYHNASEYCFCQGPRPNFNDDKKGNLFLFILDPLPPL